MKKKTLRKAKKVFSIAGDLIVAASFIFLLMFILVHFTSSSE